MISVGALYMWLAEFPLREGGGVGWVLVVAPCDISAHQALEVFRLISATVIGYVARRGYDVSPSLIHRWSRSSRQFWERRAAFVLCFNRCEDKLLSRYALARAAARDCGRNDSRRLNGQT